MNEPVLLGVILALTVALAGCSSSEPDTRALAARLDDTGPPIVSTQQFIDAALRNDLFEIAAARLAIANSMRTEEEAYAYGLMASHTEWAQQLAADAAGASPGITPDAHLTAAQVAYLTKLGEPFVADMRFDVDYMSGEIHSEAAELRLMQDYAKGGETPALRQLAGRIAPIVQRDLDNAERLMAVVGGLDTKSHYEGLCQAIAATLPVDVSVTKLPACPLWATLVNVRGVSAATEKRRDHIVDLCAARWAGATPASAACNSAKAALTRHAGPARGEMASDTQE